MTEPDSGGPLAGEPRKRAVDASSAARRAGSWLVWWILLMSFWVMLDDSINADELWVGAGVAAVAALLAELVTHQAATRFRMRFEWLVPALDLPRQVAVDMATVYLALWRRLVHGEQPPSAFLELPTRFGDDSPEGMTRRTLLIGGTSVAPNTFALGIDKDTNVMVVHRLVAGGRAGQPAEERVAEMEGT